MQKEKIPSSQILTSIRSQSNLAAALKVSAATVAIIAIYFQDLSLVFNEALNNEATSYVLLIPLLFAYFIYRKRKVLRAVIPAENRDLPTNTRHFPLLSGVILCATAIILYWHGSYTFTPLEYHILTLPIFTAGLTLILFNIQILRQALFPIAFLALLTPPPSEIMYGLGSTLSVISTEASNAIVNLLGVHSSISSQFGNPTINIIRPDNTPLSFTVNIACSGIYSLIGFLIFGLFIAYIVRDKNWKKAGIFLIGFPLIYLLNIFRITLTVLIGYQWGEQLALSLFHLLGGWILIFLGTLILLVIAEKVFKTQIFTKKTRDTYPNCNPHLPAPSETYCQSCGRLLVYQRIHFRTSDVAKIAITALVAALLISIQAPLFALTKGPAQILIQTPTGQQGNTQILPQMTEYTVSFVYRDTEFEQESRQNLSLLYAYTPVDQNQKTVWVGLEIAETSIAFGVLHRWEVCLITWPQTHGYQPSAEQLDLRDVTILENPPIIARYFAFKFKTDNQTQLVLYWYASAIFTANNASQQKMVKISLITYPEGPEDVPSMEQQLLPIAKAIAAYWEPIKTWSAIAMVISQNGISLAALTTALLVVVIVLYVFEALAQTRANAIAYGKLSKSDQQIVDILRRKEKRTIPTLDKIQVTYQHVTGQAVDTAQLERKLAELERTGVIKSLIANNQDEPTQTWKTRITFLGRKV